MARDDSVRAALFLDFDNVFSHLMQQEVEAAAAFVQDPLRWIAWLERGADRRPPEAAADAAGPAPSAPRRRILLRRCYLNPQAYAMVPGEDKPRYFSSFRHAFLRAGFQVVDTPALTRGGKTGADVVMVMDILDALAHPTRFDEFLLLSSDADFTPVLLRLREHDRRTTLVALGIASEACRAAAEAVVDFEAFASGALGLRAPQRRAPAATSAAADVLRAAILEELRAILAAAPERVPLARAAQIVQQRLGPRVLESDWGGAGSLRQLLGQADDPRIGFDPTPPGWLYDPARHAAAPAESSAEAAGGDLPALLRRLYRELGTVPTVLEPQLAFVFDALVQELPIANPTSSEIRSRISEAAKAAGLFVSFGAVNAVMHRASLGGFDWSAEPDAETPRRLRRAFRDNILAQAQRQGVALSAEEIALLDAWTGLATPQPAAEVGVAAPPPPGAHGFCPATEEPVTSEAEAEAAEAEDEWGRPPSGEANGPAGLT